MVTCTTPLRLSALLLLHHPLLRAGATLLLPSQRLTPSFILHPHLFKSTTTTTYRAMSTSTSLSASTGTGGREPVSKKASSSPVGIVWYKCSDLRTLDHAPLTTAHRENAHVYHVFCHDPRWYEEVSPATSTAIGGMEKKTGYHRARFIMESVQDLKQRLRSKGSDLVVVGGRPEDILPQIREATGATAVYCHR